MYPRLIMLCWQYNERDPDGDYLAVDVVNQALSGVAELIVDRGRLGKHFVDTSLLLVFYGDALQILQSAFARRGPQICLDNVRITATHSINTYRIAVGPQAGRKVFA